MLPKWQHCLIKFPDNSSISRVQTLSTSSNDPQAMLKAEKLLQFQAILITAI